MASWIGRDQFSINHRWQWIAISDDGYNLGGDGHCMLDEGGGAATITQLTHLYQRA
jgi:hypothetical protein